jgi:hypothetical protein
MNWPSFHHILVVGLAASLAGACQPAADGEEVASYEDAISHEEAAARLNLEEHVLAKHRASAEATRKLGIVRWDVYAVSTDRFIGFVAFASDAAGDVAYAVAGNARTSEAAVLVYDEDRVRPDQDEQLRALGREKMTWLLEDFMGVRDALNDTWSAQYRWDRRFRCGLGIAATAAAVVGGAVVIGKLAIVAGAAGAAVGLSGATLGTVQGFVVGGGGWVVGSAVAHVAFDFLRETEQACRAGF